MRPSSVLWTQPNSVLCFTEIDIPFVVCVIYWSLPTSGSPQEIAWNGPKLVYDCAVWAGAVMALILCPPLLGIYIKLICIVFMECLLKLVNSTAASGWWCGSKHPGGSVVEYRPRLSKVPHNKIGVWNEEARDCLSCCWGGVKGHWVQHAPATVRVWGQCRAVRVNMDQLHGEYVRGMATDRPLMRPLSALVLLSPPGAPVDAPHLISIEFHSTGLVYSKYVCFN